MRQALRQRVAAEVLRLVAKHERGWKNKGVWMGTSWE